MMSHNPSRYLLLTLTAALAMIPAALAQHHNRHDERVLEEDPRSAEGQLAPVLTGLGDHHHGITTSSEQAQLFFDQGLKLTYGFNHQEALRAFKEAARLDPDCAMAYWGWALVLGPNLNLPMAPEVVGQAQEAIQMALDRKKLVTEPERQYIDALAARYSPDPEAERTPFDAAYASAMKTLHEHYPDDTDAATLYAAALMNLAPWDYWTRDGQPKGHTEEILAVLEGALEKDPEHEGALHYYIHVVEPVDPERGLEAADSLRGLAPGAGHLVHMPSHIYMQVGRFAEAYEANIQAAEADEGYITQCRAQGIYPLNYYPHNVHFQTWAATLQGRSQAALASARKVASRVPGDLHGNDWALYQTFLSMPLFTMVRFGMWEEILEEPKPPETTIYWQGIWHFARGLALVHTGRAEGAQKELVMLTEITDDPTVPEVLVGFSHAARLLSIAREMLAGEIDARIGWFDSAIAHLTRAELLEDSLLYNEPPDWGLPARHTLGAVLLDAGLPEEAESVFWRDLEESRDNGFALYGLWQSLLAQGRGDDAARVKERFQLAWSDADVELTSPRF